MVIGVTDYGCLLAPSFASEARKLLDALPGIGVIDIELDAEFDWEPRDMSVAYRRHLAERRAATNQVMLPLRESAMDLAGGRATGRHPKTTENQVT
jgi:metal-sulfur cluster biosynthetic enzyme